MAENFDDEISIPEIPDDHPLSGYSKVNESGNHVTVEHEDNPGNLITIDKSKIEDPDMHQKLAVIPWKDSGEAPAELSPLQQRYNQELIAHGQPSSMMLKPGENPQDVDPNSLSIANAGTAADQRSAQEAAQRQAAAQKTQSKGFQALGLQNPNEAEALPASLQQNQAPSYVRADLDTTPQPAQQNPYGNVLGNIDAIGKDYQDQIEASTKLGLAMGKSKYQALNEARRAMSDSNGQYSVLQDKIARNQQIADALTNDISSGRVKPDTMFHDGDTSGNIVRAISLALGGAASHWTGGRNLALDTINRSIDKDLEAQKADLGRRQTLLSTVMDQTKNLQQAQMISRNHLMDIARLKIDEAAAKNTDLSVAQNAAQLKQQMHEQMLKLGMPVMQNLMKAKIRSGPVSAQDLAIYGEDEDRKNAVKVGDVYYPAGDPKTASELNSKLASASHLSAGAGRLSQLNPAIPEDREMAEQIMTAMGVDIAKVTGGRMTPAFLDMLKKEMIRNPAQFMSYAGKNPNQANSRMVKDITDSVLGEAAQSLRGYSVGPQIPESKLSLRKSSGDVMNAGLTK